ncbi:terminase small subunit [Oxalobacter aliiformigenes]|uniref:Terminase small subunit n=1 Tax=Oxalobacter aliiformigenes TaxID=2946593 RepID=A0ABY7JKF6_9BURK|nr:terminase small subunit [Oxalobacter aliiformigenes]WAV93578.1 terminase small subunit [Oxalobacter aliiformigenes]WAV94925.1 terminase small subunit [Oxalobacter aliiformigenes]WAV97273.1 terminase small subunit [Oxalobacter aliiformigenes]
MNELTQKQENFCLAYIETGNASEAYRKAYNAAGSSEKSVWELASKMLDNPKVISRLEALREQAARRALLTLERHLEELATLRDEARAEGRYSAAIAAEIARGKAAGLYVEQSRTEGEIRMVWAGT